MAMGRGSNGQQQELFWWPARFARQAIRFIRHWWLMEKHKFDSFAEETCRELCAKNREHPDDDGGVSGRSRRTAESYGGSRCTRKTCQPRCAALFPPPFGLFLLIVSFPAAGPVPGATHPHSGAGAALFPALWKPLPFANCQRPVSSGGLRPLFEDGDM